MGSICVKFQLEIRTLSRGPGVYTHTHTHTHTHTDAHPALFLGRLINLPTATMVAGEAKTQPWWSSRLEIVFQGAPPPAPPWSLRSGSKPVSQGSKNEGAPIWSVGALYFLTCHGK